MQKADSAHKFEEGHPTADYSAHVVDYYNLACIWHSQSMRHFRTEIKI